MDSEADRIAIGSSEDADLVISSDAAVSLLHAALERAGSRWLIRDLESTNGTLVNGERLPGDRLLRDGDEVVLGRTRLRFHDGQHPPLVVVLRPERGGGGGHTEDREPRQPVRPSRGPGDALELPDT